MRTTKIEITLDWMVDFRLEDAIRTAIQTRWQETLLMHRKDGYWFRNHSENAGDSHYFGDLIDSYADMLLQVREQVKDKE